MAEIEETFWFHLKTVAGHARVYPELAPQGATTPYIVYQKTDLARERDFTGPGGLDRTRFQVRHIADSYAAVKTSAAALRGDLDGRNNYDMGDTGQQINIRSAVLDDETDEGSFPTDSSEKGKRSVRQDWLLWHV